jgi:hypothetical protein
MLSAALCLTSTSSSRPGKMLNSAVGLPARVQIPVPPSANSRLLYELLRSVRLGFLVVSPLRIACVFLHVEQGQSSKRVWYPRIIYLFISCLPSSCRVLPILLRQLASSKWSSLSAASPLASVALVLTTTDSGPSEYGQCCSSCMQCQGGALWSPSRMSRGILCSISTSSYLESSYWVLSMFDLPDADIWK